MHRCVIGQKCFAFTGVVVREIDLCGCLYEKATLFVVVGIVIPNELDALDVLD